MLNNVLLKNLAGWKPEELLTLATEGSAAFDVRSAEDITCYPNEINKIPTGIAIAMPVGMACLVLPRSGIASKDLCVINSPGLIDTDFRGQVLVLVKNRSAMPIHFKRGDRVAQVMFVPYFTPSFDVVEELPETGRGEGGFGSSGLK